MLSCIVENKGTVFWQAVHWSKIDTAKPKISHFYSTLHLPFQNQVPTLPKMQSEYHWVISLEAIYTYDKYSNISRNFKSEENA